ncbi:MAG: cytochrome bd-type quinol oxidase subunit 1-like protein [Myxococcales bacterium]|nr:cytochrome bd-type quinol oxidase subunit 1-like protein [Myxococcales bacterium]
MAPLPYYPVNTFGPLMKGMVIGGVGILHVFLAQFAIGGGMLLCYFERLAQRGREADARKLVDGYFQILVLVSFVIGALTGVAMWFTTIQVGARTIGLMVDQFHWLWATEWVCFSVEVVAGYAFVRAGKRLSDRARLSLLGLYAVASWLSLFFINGILAWQLTPGRYLDGGGMWAGFFNPSFWPSLFYRTAVAMVLAALAACIVINSLDLPREPPAGGSEAARRAALIRRASRFAIPMIAMPLLGVWYFLVLPADSRAWLLGGSTPMTMFVGIAIGSSLLIGAYVLFGLVVKRLYVNAASAALLVALAFGATAAGEFVREGARKPYTVRGVLYSNSITPAEVAELRRTGVTANDPYPLRDDARYPTEQLRRGAKVERALCDACHTINGANSLVELTRTWTDDQLGQNIAKLQRTKGFMPPFAGNAEDVEAIGQLLRWEAAGTPAAWPDTTDPKTLQQIAKWLEEAGTK